MQPTVVIQDMNLSKIAFNGSVLEIPPRVCLCPPLHSALFTGIMSSIRRFGRYLQFPLTVILFDRVLFYVDDPITLEGILTAPECINKTLLQNGFFANKGLLHARG